MVGERKGERSQRRAGGEKEERRERRTFGHLVSTLSASDVDDDIRVGELGHGLGDDGLLERWGGLASFSSLPPPFTSLPKRTFPHPKAPGIAVVPP